MYITFTVIIYRHKNVMENTMYSQKAKLSQWKAKLKSPKMLLPIHTDLFYLIIMNHTI